MVVLMARVPHVDPELLPGRYEILDEQADKLPDDITAEWWNSQSTVRTFGNNPELARTHVYTNVSMWTKTKLTPQEVECVILAVGRAMESAYEWHDHVFAALERAGMDRSTVLAISRGETERLSNPERMLVEYAFEYVDRYGAVSDETHAALADHYEDDVIVGIAMLAGYYVFIQHVASALGLELDEEFVGWELENY